MADSQKSSGGGMSNPRPRGAGGWRLQAAKRAERVPSIRYPRFTVRFGPERPAATAALAIRYPLAAIRFGEA